MQPNLDSTQIWGELPVLLPHLVLQDLHQHPETMGALGACPSKNIIIGDDRNNILNNINNIILIGNSNICDSESSHNNIIGNSNIILSHINPIINVDISCNNILGTYNKTKQLNNSIIIGNYNSLETNNINTNLIYIGNDLNYKEEFTLNIDNTFYKDNNNIFTKNEILYELH